MLVMLANLHEYFSVKKAYEAGLVDKLVPGYSLNRFRKMRLDMYGEPEYEDPERPRFTFKRDAASGASS
ncbi:ATP-dependent Clp protease proteolytic subunit [Haematococcus lacustris]|uniref:ATP-dependent Clp protease proteolytic subunit n=1 Tax=Haematococcus lacustris TaxID=44745 RepID=A0A699YYB0_HAELA|nr:ATP-dependent Clp protease proteolytic subunit [Haematococcus lacustris]